ncbi:hypothetical protein [Bosea sp. Tri-44]|uniref:hypothetical protein n=1 Tax=Bosea sp. Tri-44 TaxID=1972137 RepID=UPI00100DAFEC|nr:hypothetical protein [Bosea sp. Tri-44]
MIARSSSIKLRLVCALMALQFGLAAPALSEDEDLPSWDILENKIVYGVPNSDIIGFVAICGPREKQVKAIIAVKPSSEDIKSGQKLVLQAGKSRIETTFTPDDVDGETVIFSTELKPLLALLRSEGTITAKIGKSTTSLPPLGQSRALATRKFESGCAR